MGLGVWWPQPISDDEPCCLVTMVTESAGAANGIIELYTLE